jgi:C1A family cysteine protease
MLLLGDGTGNNVGGGLLGDGSGNNAGGGLLGRGGTLSADLQQTALFGKMSHLLFGDGSGNNAGGGLFGVGYIPDYPDDRDYQMERLIAAADETGILTQFRRPSRHKRPGEPKLPTAMDLTKKGYFGPVDAQGAVQSCTAHAVTSMAEYHLHRKKGSRMDLSRLFLYKIARDLLGVDGDRGCTLRESLKALEKYGCLKEERWPYDWPWLERLPRIRDLEESKDLRGIRYCRLDDYNADGARTLENLLLALTAGFPVAFGFSICSCIDTFGRDSVMPIPTPSSRVIGAHAVLAVGYRQSGTFKNREGAILFRNSWGERWGKKGYGWLPFQYILRQLASDFWTLY